jgi:dTDP-4-amino-4,6-dideoxygalactose transaminase
MRFGVESWAREWVRRYAPARTKVAMRKILRRLPAREVGPDSYPRMLGDELGAVTRVLKSGAWNMLHGQELVHRALEEEFASYVGAKYAVAVNTGGMAIQIALRALGVKPGDEVVHQVDTCVANAFAIMGAGGTPIFADIDPSTMMLSRRSVESAISSRTKILMPIHMWGNSEDLDMVTSSANSRGFKVLEDCCLSLGTKYKGKHVGTSGDAAIFSFGMLKPIQAGEGGMIVTNDDSLAREFRTIRSYGDRILEYGERDQRTPSWNGRMSEILAAILLEQVRNYDRLLAEVQANVAYFVQQLRRLGGIELVHNNRPIKDAAYTQVVLRITDPNLGVRKADILTTLSEDGVGVWHANFEPINSLSFFREGYWKDWVARGDLDWIGGNYAGPFPNAESVFRSTGIGLFRENFLSSGKTRRAIRALERALGR